MAVAVAAGGIKQHWFTYGRANVSISVSYCCGWAINSHHGCVLHEVKGRCRAVFLQVLELA
jgi:hypothetical protein